MPDLYHYTCDHGHDAIGQAGYLRPLTDLVDDPRLQGAENARWVWLTDLAAPMRGALGLTSHTLSCDRTAYRYRVTQEVHGAVAWTTVRRLMSPDQREALEGAPGARPKHWWVCRYPIGVTYDPLLVVTRA